MSSAKGVVIERGLRNYAGAHCPGKGWTCAGTKHTVVQIAKRGGLNRFACANREVCRRAVRGRLPWAERRWPRVVSLAATGQHGVVHQDDGHHAVLHDQPAERDRDEQGRGLDGHREAHRVDAVGDLHGVDHAGSGFGGQAPRTRTSPAFIRLSRSTGSTTTPIRGASRSRVTLTSRSRSSRTRSDRQQHRPGRSAHSGKSYDCNSDATSPLTQDESLTSFVTGKGSITQKQDTATTGSANVVVDIEQNQSTGFKCTSATCVPRREPTTQRSTQTSDMEAVANTPKGPVIQTQSADVPNPPYSGIVGTINQDSSNTSTAHATQTETQCEDAVNLPTIPATCDTAPHGHRPSYSITQTQYGPEGVFTPPAQQSGPVALRPQGLRPVAADRKHRRPVLPQPDLEARHRRRPAQRRRSNIIVGDCTSGTVLGCQAGQTATLNGLGINDGYTSPTITRPHHQLLQRQRHL